MSWTWTAICTTLLIAVVAVFFLLVKEFGRSQAALYTILLMLMALCLFFVIKRQFLSGAIAAMLLFLASFTTVVSPAEETKSRLIDLVDSVPDVLQSVPEIATYLRGKKLSDAWWNPIIVEVSDDQNEVVVKSLGKDNRPGGDQQNADISIKIRNDSGAIIREITQSFGGD